MHKIKAGLRRLALLLLPAVPMALAGLTSCDKVIYDYEGDCSIHYVVNFRYDYNMLDADAFASQVECITLYVIDSDGNIVLKQSDEGSALAAEGYHMELSDSVEPGTYTLVAWGKARDNNSFSVYDGGLFEDMTCTLNCSYDASDAPYVDGEVDELFYGIRDSVVLGSTKGETYTATVPLMKDTNKVQIALQQIAGGEISADDFTFTIESDNWVLDCYNEPVAPQEMTYYAFYTSSVELEDSANYGDDDDSDDGSGDDGGDGSDDGSGDGDDDDDNGDETPDGPGPHSVLNSVSTRATTYTVYAEFNISRIMAEGGDRVVVYNNNTGEVTLSYNLAQLATLFKGYYNRGYSNQEFLDREDTYAMTFFLDSGLRWIGVSINIESWNVVDMFTGL